MKLGFVPDRRNLGGKKDIDNLQRNHLLALINAKSVTNNKTPPCQPVAHIKKKRQKSLGQIQIEFREVYESQKRVLQMKKGGIDNSKPVCFDRKNFIKNRACLAKDIETQDHRRNLVSLSKRLNEVDSQFEKNRQKMKEEQQRQQTLQSKFCSRHDHSLFQNAADAYSVLRKRPQSASTRSFVKGIGSQRQSIDYSQIQNKNSIIPVDYGYKNKSFTNLNPQRSQSHLVSMDYSEMLLDDQNNQSQLQAKIGNNNRKKKYLESEQNFMESGTTGNNNGNGMEFYGKENQGDDEDVEYLYQKNKSENSIQDLDQLQQQQGKHISHYKNNPSTISQNQKQQQYPQPIQQAIPFITVTSSNDPYTDLRRSLLNVIMDYKLYDKEQMMDLANLVKRKNTHLDLQQIQGVIKHIIVRLYGEF